ncbi:hypothetical protein [Mycobacterium riyadhense]|uniref:Uncharacterized protein n=1 Tax=Mycobacterium riyadhense TaxID=486698 RepID=A0A1X2CSU7_9MYCO|nr:hypothetical protein [Mycobacterium riyadhense]MCV7147132.1 hypothetical protein [Mycobacterium riyadhense]ORW78429.1 hypothetical protein AWC22_19980 [Mycobacterium riyadhense]VTP04086.1 hypothetical protein BIN_B_05394 [Mycobacterium riyadhense]
MNTARERARDEVLTDGLIDWVSLSRVNWQVIQHYPTAHLSEVQNETLELVRSMAAEGLIELGEMSNDDGRFVAWDEPLERSMQRIYEAYVTHHDNRLGWVHRYWLNLTDKGRQLILSTEEGQRVARAEKERLR